MEAKVTIKAILSLEKIIVSSKTDRKQLRSSMKTDPMESHTWFRELWRRKVTMNADHIHHEFMEVWLFC